jgi:uncharacterized repeat protein (TIGR01451 family)
MGLLLALASPPQAQVLRPFEARASFEQRGDIAMVGNVLLTCSVVTSGAFCTAAQNGTLVADNNDFNMINVDIEPSAGLANSSSADLVMPAASEVLFAGLYWGARAPADSATRGTIHLRPPGALEYQSVAAAALDTYTTSGNSTNHPYQAFADVTSIVADAGSGTYFVGGITATTGLISAIGAYGGWALVVVYRSADAPLRRLAVYDGAVTVGVDASLAIEVSDLLTPLDGAFDTFLGALIWDGDLSRTGDAFSLEGTALSDALNPVGNFWNSSITRLGVRVDAKEPDFVNQLGMDLDYVDASGALGNGATSASIEFSTSNDVHYAHALAFAVDLFLPDVGDLQKTVDVAPEEQLVPGQEIAYTISFSNSGNDAAAGTTLVDTIPVGTSYVPGSLEILANASGALVGIQTDDAGDDVAEFDTVGNRVVFRLGAGANASAGGSVPAGEGASVQFRVRINDDDALSETLIENRATLEYAATALADRDFTADAEVSVVVGAVADLWLQKEGPAEVGSGAVIEYRLLAGNAGPAAAHEALVQDDIPSGITDIEAECVATTGGAICGSATVTAGIVSLTMIEFPPGAEVEIAVRGTAPQGPAELSNIAGIVPPAPVHDSNPSNNTDIAVTGVEPPPTPSLPEPLPVPSLGFGGKGVLIALLLMMAGVVLSRARCRP